MSPQHPLPSGFGAKTTIREVIGERRLDGTTAIVTGGYAGIGLETTRVLAAAGAHVIVPARDIAKATAALSGLANVTIDELEPYGSVCAAPSRRLVRCALPRHSSGGP
jgi:hypothetical protein